MTRTRQAILDELGGTAGALDPAPASVIVFGSVARGDATMESDIDVVIVRPARVDEEDPGWRLGIDQWRDHARRLTGNSIEILEVGERDVDARLRSRKPVWVAIRRDGVVVHGPSLDALREPIGA